MSLIRGGITQERIRYCPALTCRQCIRGIGMISLETGNNQN